MILLLKHWKSEELQSQLIQTGRTDENETVDVRGGSASDDKTMKLMMNSWIRI